MKATLGKSGQRAARKEKKGVDEPVPFMAIERGPHGWCVVRKGTFAGNIPYGLSYDELMHRLSRLEFPSADEREMAALLACNEIGSDWEGVACQLTRHARLLWEALHVLATKAKNSNIKNDAATTLGRIYREVARRNKDPDGKKSGDAVWSELKKCGSFVRQRHPYGLEGGKIPAQDLQRWTELQMECRVAHFWSGAIWVASDADPNAVPGKTGSLQWAWARERARLNPADLIDRMSLEVCNHPFSRASLKELTEFPLFWDVVLKALLKDNWDADRKAGELRVKGEQHFEKRAGAVRTVANDYFERFLKPRMQRHRALMTDAEWKQFLEG